MTTDEKYINRCIQLAKNGRGYVKSNPMVGSVVVCDGKIIGEGFHRKYGEPHAEVNAISSVRDKSLLKKSTIYVSLEPCSHHGKTPPCSQLIIDSKIPKVVVACLDPFPAVSGKGIKILRNAGINVITGILEQEALELNKEFITAQLKDRPYIYLKWAQSKDGFIDRLRQEGDGLTPAKISNSFTSLLTHKRRAEISAILVGTNTAILDNPSLSTRLWFGQHPIRVVIDKSGRINSDSQLFDGKIETIIFTEKDKVYSKKNIDYQTITFNENILAQIVENLKKRGVNSILIEGGEQTLQSFINQDLWDEAFIETSISNLKDGIAAPKIVGQLIRTDNYYTSTVQHLRI